VNIVVDNICELIAAGLGNQSINALARHFSPGNYGELAFKIVDFHQEKNRVK
jgi:hypothetical protein